MTGRILLLGLSALIAASCATAPTGRNALEEARLPTVAPQPEPPAAEQSQEQDESTGVIEMLRAMEVTKPVVSYPMVTLNAMDVPLGDALRMIGELVGYTIKTDGFIQEFIPVTVRVRNKPLDSVLDSILHPLGYDFSIDPVKKEIYVASLAVKEFYLSRTLGSEVYQVRLGGSPQQQVGVSGVGEVTFVRAQTEDFWTALERNIKNLLTERGKVVIDRFTGRVVVSDAPHALRSVEVYMSKLCEKLPRVVVNVEVYEVLLNKEHRQGIKWEALLEGKYVQTGTSISFPLESSITNLGQIKAALIQPRTIGGTTKLTTGDILLGFLKTYGDVKVVSKPQISLLSGSSAYISVGKVVPYLKRVEKTVTADGLTSWTPEMAEVHTGFQLVLSARVEGDQVVMEISPIMNEVDTWQNFKIGGTTAQEGAVEFANPIVSARHLSTSVRVKSGTRVVLGGLMYERRKLDEQKVPFLGDVPLLKEMFRQKTEASENVELVISITPVLVEEG
ncbi:MAG: hypothetical protein QXY39_02245 [Thermofilaceae archaeon]